MAGEESGVAGSWDLGVGSKGWARLALGLNGRCESSRAGRAAEMVDESWSISLGQVDREKR